MSRSGNPAPSSSHTHPAVRKKGLARMAEIERQSWAGYLLGVPVIALSAQIGCDRRTVDRAIARVMTEMRGDLPPSQEGRVMVKLASLQNLRVKLATRIQAGDVSAIGEARRLIVEEAKLLDLFPANRAEISGSGGGPITFEMVPHEEKAQYLRELSAEAARRAKAIDAALGVIKPKALTAGEESSPKKRTAKRTKRAAKKP